MVTTMSQTELLRELDQVVVGELNRHEKVAKEWFPHEYVPWSDGRSFDGRMGGEKWSEKDSDTSDVARSALIVNLLTEDNLPSYHREIAAIFGRDDAWGEWVHRWTAEEGRHAIAMRDYMLVKRMVDPIALERFRMQHMSAGYELGHDGELMKSLAYVSFQELATRVSHRNTGKFTNDPMCETLLARIAADENLHMIFYRNLMSAAIEISPDQAIVAILAVVKSFEMPGTGIPGFQRKAVEMAVEGIYDLRQHRDDVLDPILRFWKIFEIQGLSPAGEAARTELATFMADLDKQARRFEDKREMLKSRLSPR
ncbi:MAG: acyl-[acyl-carrier-protein] desaturase [Actinomycetota bacterium]|jgi:acyl-[acyl-carrier-protein] desaturase|nr:acyl-[acyl-carrier-protein] desaturase [Actinomycetota bacterium]